MKRFYSLSIFLMFLTGFASGQEIISGLQVNIQVKNKALQEKSSRVQETTLTLPFFDDFYRNSVLPDPQLWSDADVFISNDYAVEPPTVGVATFDAMDNLGRLYENASEFPFKADFLTSQKIRLDSLFLPVPRRITRADSLYFSFYYQPQGLGNSPAKNDSLVLEFLAPGETVYIPIPADTTIIGNDTIITPADTVVIEGWNKVWSSPGMSLEVFSDTNTRWFRQVIIPVIDSVKYYSPEFRFRFRNYASLAGGILPDWQSNGDQWNIDYVYLNIDRGINDTLHRDVAFAGRAPQMLVNYTSMPYNQYKANFIEEMRDSLNLKITNLDGITYPAYYRYEVSRDYGEPFKIYSGENFGVPPFITSGYANHQPSSHPPVNFQFPIGNQEKVYFTTTHILTTDANIGRRQNDTIRNVQLFANYLSYDDGTAEAGYGLSSVSGQVAYRFQLNTPDSLLAIQMYFNQTLNGGNVNDFYLNIWNDYFGAPGDLIYSKFGYEPVYTDSLNKFFTYKPDSTIQIEEGNFPNLIFYVGWQQVTSDNLNIGFDKNTDASSKIFFRDFGNWNTSLYKGALMIRPVIGKEKVVGVPENSSGRFMKIYPNPTISGKVMVELPENSDNSGLYTIVYTSTGKQVVEKLYNRNEDFSYLPSGVYILQVMSDDGTMVGRDKLLINR